MPIPASSSKPLRLKQRTSSVDQRRDYSTQTWTSLLGMLKLREFVVTVDHFSIWRRHLAWAVPNGKDLREYMTQRYASSMVFMSLLLSTELQVLFNSAGVTTRMRHALIAEEYLTIGFWAGMAILMSAILTLLGLISTFTAWTMVSAVSDTNSHCIFRSSIGQYVAELPGRFIVGSIYSFMFWLILFFFLLLPVGAWSMLLLTIVMVLFVHTITAFSAFGRVIMHTGAMGSQPIFKDSYELQLHPHGLHNQLAIKARANLSNKTSIMRQYRSKVEPLDRMWSEDELSCHLSERSSALDTNVTPPTPLDSLPHPTRKRTASLVKFSDGYDTNGDKLGGDDITPRNVSVNTGWRETTPMSALTSGSPGGNARGIPRPPTSPKRHSHKEAGNVAEKWLASNHESDSFFTAKDHPPVTQITAPRNPSVVSSIVDTMAEEERFEREYGGLFDPETSTQYSFEYSSDGGERQENEDGLEPTGGSPEEETGLLEADQLEMGNYSSIP